MRVVEAFVEKLDLRAMVLEGTGPQGLPGGRRTTPGAPQDLYLRLSKPDPVEPAPGARDATKHRADVIDRSADAELQDDHQLPQG